MDFEQERLSQREEEILRLAAQGLTDKQIASATGVQLSTVRTYWDRLKNKLRATNRTEAVAKAIRVPEFHIVESIPHMVVVGDPHGKIIYANSRWTSFFGQHDSILHTNRGLLIHPEDGDPFTQMWRRAHAKARVEHATVRYRRPDGTYSRHLASVAPFHREADRIMSLIGVSIDLAHVDG